MRLLITGGGTGGHVYPLLAVLPGLAVPDRGTDVKRDVLYVGRAGSIEERLAAQSGIRFAPIHVGGLRSLSPLTLGRNAFRLVRAVAVCEGILGQFRPQAVLATGGYVSAPAIWAAARRGVPAVIYLPDLEPGWAIRLLSRWARRVAVSFPEVSGFFRSGQAVVTGYPVRAEFYRATREEGRRHFQLDPAQPVVTIFGGSQGAHSINEAVRANLDELLSLAQLIHISGAADEAMLQGHRATLSEPGYSRYHLFGYLDDEMPLALAAADVVIARAGAATLGEFPAVGAPSILVPYPFAGRHQNKNAEFLVSRGAAVRLEDETLGTGLTAAVRGLLQDSERLVRMAAAARALARPDAAANLADLLRQVAR